MSRQRRPSAPRLPKTPPSRVSRDKILTHLRLAAKKGDRSALEIALAQMRTLALSPRYWEKYLGLLRNPLARLVDLTVIKQGDRIMHQKGWKLPKPARADASASVRADGEPKKRKTREAARRRAAPPDTHQPSLFDAT